MVHKVVIISCLGILVLTTIVLMIISIINIHQFTELLHNSKNEENCSKRIREMAKIESEEENGNENR